MLRTLFQAHSIDDLAEGHTNVPLAVPEGVISEFALTEILQQLEKMTAWPSSILISSVDVLRVDAGSRTVHYVAVDVTGAFLSSRPSAYDYYRFSIDGRFLSKERGRKFRDFDFAFSIATFGVYALIRQQLSSVKMNERQHDKLSALYTKLVTANREDARKFAESIPVYLESAQDVQVLTGQTAKLVHVQTPAQFVSGRSQIAVQIAARLLGATAVISYQQASPARGTPVVLE